MGVMQNVTENINVGKLLDNWDETHELTKDEALAILNCDDVCLDKLIETAYALRLKYKGKKVSIQLLTNVRSGNCSQNCAYCAQSCESQAQIEKYKRVSDEKLYGDNDLVDNKHLARHCIGLSGISFTDAEIEDLAGRIRKMKKNDTQICCSIGFLTEKQALMLKEAGWQISFKDLLDIKCDDWGDEVPDVYDRSENVINFELELKNYDKENMHIARYEPISIDNVYYDNNGFIKPPYLLRFRLNGTIFNSLYNTIENKQFKHYFEQFHPELEIDDETDYEEYVSQEQSNEIYFKSYFDTIKKIAELMVESIKLLYKTEDKIIKIYTDEELLIKSDEKSERNVTNREIEMAILNSMYFYVPYKYAKTLNKAINKNDISILKEDSWWKNMSKYIDIKNL